MRVSDEFGELSQVAFDTAMEVLAEWLVEDPSQKAQVEVGFRPSGSEPTHGVRLDVQDDDVLAALAAAVSVWVEALPSIPAAGKIAIGLADRQDGVSELGLFDDGVDRASVVATTTRRLVEESAFLIWRRTC